MRILLAFVSIFCTLTSFAQNWTRQQIIDSVSVLFPHEPKYKMEQGAELYFDNSPNCAFMVVVMPNIIRDYAAFVNHKADMQEKIINATLNGYVYGRIKEEYSNVEVRATKIEHYTCKEFNFTAVNPAIGKEGKAFVKVIIAEDKIISFDCWYLNDNNEADIERTTFFDSILVE